MVESPNLYSFVSCKMNRARGKNWCTWAIRTTRRAINSSWSPTAWRSCRMIQTQWRCRWTAGKSRRPCDYEELPIACLSLDSTPNKRWRRITSKPCGWDDLAANIITNKGRKLKKRQYQCPHLLCVIRATKNFETCIMHEASIFELSPIFLAANSTFDWDRISV